MPLTAGSICVISFPFTDKAAAKLRPALIVEPLGGFYLALTELESGATKYAVFLPITSKPVKGIYNITVDESSPYLAETGLKAPSTILCWNLHTVPKAFIKREIGTAPPELMSQVKERLRALLSL